MPAGGDRHREPWLRHALTSLGVEDVTFIDSELTPPRLASPCRVRSVVVDDTHQPAYLKRAAALEQAVLTAAAWLGVEAEDMPGLRGLWWPVRRRRQVGIAPPPMR